MTKELNAEGFYVWLDQLYIPPGACWDGEVEKALEECGIFMIIMTPGSISSENVRDEIGYAIDYGKTHGGVECLITSKPFLYHMPGGRKRKSAKP